MATKRRVNHKRHVDLIKLSARLAQHYADPSKQSFTMWRGDYRAVLWAVEWINKALDSEAAQ